VALFIQRRDIFSHAFLRAWSFKNLYVPDLFLNDEPLSLVSSCKYLGVVVNDNLHDDEDILRHVKSVYARGNMLISRFRHCSDDVKLKLFKSFLSNAYGSHLWCTYRQLTYKRSVVAYNNVFRKLFRIQRGTSISAVYVRHNIDSFGVIMRKSVFSFKTRLSDSGNILVQTILSSLSFRCNSAICAKWRNVLYL
jgi:hypothetical protein